MGLRAHKENLSDGNYFRNFMNMVFNSMKSNKCFIVSIKRNDLNKKFKA